MRLSPTSVLDASALMAYLEGERGASAVAGHVKRGAVISTANWAEVLAKLSDRGLVPDDFARQFRSRGVLDKKLGLEPVDESIAMESARLRAATSSRGLSVGDRICLATGLKLKLPVVTADRIWEELALGIPIIVIR